MKIDAGLNIYPDGDKNFSTATINHSCHAPVENCYLLLVYLFSWKTYTCLVKSNFLLKNKWRVFFFLRRNFEQKKNTDKENIELETDQRFNQNKIKKENAIHCNNHDDLPPPKLFLENFISFRGLLMPVFTWRLFKPFIF